MDLPAGRFTPFTDEASVDSGLLLELCMGALLIESAVVCHPDLIGMFCRLEPMCDHDHSLSVRPENVFLSAVLGDTFCSEPMDILTPYLPPCPHLLHP